MSPKSTSNYPLMGGKSFCYEAAMRVPLVVKWPAGITASRAGRRESTRTVAVDFVPTWLEMAGIAAPDSVATDGVSILTLITEGRRPMDRPIFFHHPHYTHAAGPFSSVISDDWKLIRFYNDTSGGEQLFDLAADPFEQDDLSRTRPERSSALRKLLDKWLAEVDAELPIPNETFDSSEPPVKDRKFTWELALKERAEHERKWRASEAGRQ
jgi:arylsulfatase A-like enzyme